MSFTISKLMMKNVEKIKTLKTQKINENVEKHFLQLDRDS